MTSSRAAGLVLAGELLVAAERRVRLLGRVARHGRRAGAAPLPHLPAHRAWLSQVRLVVTAVLALHLCLTFLLTEPGCPRYAAQAPPPITRIRARQWCNATRGGL